MQYLLENAPPSSLPDTAFSKGVKRALRAILALDEVTENLELDFRCRKSSTLDLLVKDRSLIINDKWLDFLASHTATQCSLYKSAVRQSLDIVQFSCVHNLEDIYDLILLELAKESNRKPSRGITSRGRLCLEAKEKINDMPLEVNAIQGEKPLQLRVSWIHSRSIQDSKLHGIETEGLITLHRHSTCFQKISDLLAPSK